MKRLFSLFLFALFLNAASAYALDNCVVPNTKTYFVNEHSECREVANTTGQDIMVPTKTATEWATGGSSFLDNTPSGIALASCPISDPCIVSGLTQTGTVSNTNLDAAYGLTVSGNYAYVVSDVANSLTIIDISNPASPTQVGTISNANLNSARGVAVDGNYAYVTSRANDRLTIINITNKSSPSQVGTISNANLDGARGVAVDGNYAYVASFLANSLTIFNITNKSSPSQVGTISNANLSNARDVAVVGNYAYVTAGVSNSLTVINITNKSSPSQVGTISNTNLSGATGLAVQGNYAYVAVDTGDRLTIIDISNPASPSQAGTITNASLNGAYGVAVDGNYAYVASRAADSLTVIDVSNPASPTIVDTISNTSLDGARDVVVSNGYAYVASFNGDSLTTIEPSCETDGASCTEKVDCPNIGNVCSDGTVYAGLSPDGNVPMYTTPADAPSLMSWNKGTSTRIDTTMQNCSATTPSGLQASCRTGESNTAILVGLNGLVTQAPYMAAEYCNGISDHGQNDWYLPSQDELTVLYSNSAVIGGFVTSNTYPTSWYWSSTEVDQSFARRLSMFDGGQNNLGKHLSVSVRCVRK